MRLREKGSSLNRNNEYRTRLRDLVSKGIEKWTVGGMGKSSFQVVPLKAEQQNCLWRIIKTVFKEGRADGG